MKKIGLIIFICMLTTAYSQEISIDSKNVDLSEEFEVSVKINANETIGVGFDLIFDKNILKALKVEEGDLMKKCKSTTFHIIPPIISDGKIEFQDLCFEETLTGEGTIAVITFKAKSLGESDLVLQNAYIFDKKGDPMQNIKITNGKITVNLNVDDSRTDSGLGGLGDTGNLDYYLKRNQTNNDTHSTKTLKTIDAFVFPSHPSEGEKVEIKVFSDGKSLTNATIIYNKNTYHTNKEGIAEIIAVNGSNLVIVKKEGYENKEIILYVSSSVEEIKNEENKSLENKEGQEKINKSKNITGDDNAILYIILIVAVLLTVIIAYKKLK